MVHGAFKAAKAAALDFQPMPLMQEYLDQMVAEDRNADYIRTVRNGLHHFAEFLRSEDVVSPEEITRTHIIRFQAHCNQRVTKEEWAKSYSIQVLKKARAWINWMFELNYITTMPWVQIRVGTVPKQPKPLSDDDVRLLFFAHQRDAFRLDPFSFHRRETILCLLYGWGLRIHELEALTVESMDQRLDFVVVPNKGGGKKTLPYTPQIKTVVRRWISIRAQHATLGVDSLLITTTGNQLTKEVVRTIVTDLGKSVGVHVNPHRLRDTFGTHMLDDDVPVERVQKIYGHSNQQQTLAYARVNDKKVFESVADNMDPRLRDLFANTRDLRPSGTDT